MTSLFLPAALLTELTTETPTRPGRPTGAHYQGRPPLAPGGTVTIRAVVHIGTGMGNLRHVQDANAGLTLYAPPHRRTRADKRDEYRLHGRVLDTEPR